MLNEIQSTVPSQRPQVQLLISNKNNQTSGALFESKNKTVSTQSIKGITPSFIAQEIADEIFKGGFPKLDNAIIKINSDNVFKVLEEYKKISDKKNTFLGKLLDDETLFEAILDESISKEKKKEFLNHIKAMMEQSIAKDQGNTEILSEEFDKAIENTLKSFWPFQKPEKLNNCAAKFAAIQNQINSLKKASDEKVVFRGEVYNDIKENKLDKLYPDILGDGKFNNNAKQISGTCWIHGNVNAMIQTKKGREYLNNIIYKNPKNGNISVYLKAAKEEGLPKDRKDGIFTFNEEEIAAAAELHSIGDGDYTALVLAIDDFLKSIEDSTFWPPSADYGGSMRHFYSIFYGKYTDATFLNAPWIDSGDKDSKYNEIRKYFEEEKGAISVALPPTGKYVVMDLDNEEGGFDAILSEQHVYAIKAMTDEYVYLIDSNRPEKPVKVGKDTFIECFIASLWNL